MTQYGSFVDEPGSIDELQLITVFLFCVNQKRNLNNHKMIQLFYCQDDFIVSFLSD